MSQLSLFGEATAYGRESRGAIIMGKNDEYRYKLHRCWYAPGPTLLFIMLNPSTADGHDDDPTIRRCRNFAKAWGFGGIKIGNLMAYRTSRPSELLDVRDPVGPENAGMLREMAISATTIVCAWGGISKGKGGKPIVADPLHYLMHECGIDPGKLWALAINKDGSPQHPLYVSADTELIMYPPA